MKQNLKNCPRCRGVFQCNAGQTGPCQCSFVILTSNQRAAIATLFQDCLCAACLSELAVLLPDSVSQNVKKDGYNNSKND